MSEKISNVRMLNLQLFAEGAAAGDGGTGANGQSAELMLATSQAGNEPAKKADEGAANNSAPNFDAEFEELIKGKHKDAFDAKVKSIIGKRLKSTNETVARFNELSPALEILAKKYGVDQTDIKAIVKAIEEDDSNFEAEALETGMTVDNLRNVKKMERELNAFKKQDAERIAQENYQRLVKQVDDTKAFYPNFDIDSEMQNAGFVRLLKSGVDVKTAYEVSHKDEIIQGAMKYSAQQTSRQVANSVIANGARPTENGVNAQAPAVVKSNVSQLTKAQRAAAIAAAQRGERISYS